MPSVSNPVPESRSQTPLPLRIAAVVVLLEGLATIGFGISEVLHLNTDRLVMGATTALFFVVYGAALVVCAWGLSLPRSWARGPLLFAQLVWLGLAWNFREGETWPIAVLLAVAGALTLVGMLHPRSIEALEQS